MHKQQSLFKNFKNVVAIIVRWLITYQSLLVYWQEFTFPKNTPTLTLCLLVPSADNLCKQLGSDQDLVGPDLDPNVWHADGIPERYSLIKDDFEKYQKMTKQMKNYTASKELK